MLKFRAAFSVVILAGCMVAAAASATSSNPSVQQILDQQFGSGEISAVSDRLADGTDAAWTAQPGATTTLLFEFAGFAADNIFGIYDPTAPNYRLPLFHGFAGGGDDATLTVETLQGGVRFSVTAGGVTESALFGSSVFGFYLRTPQSNVFFSDTALNQDGFDHLWAYEAGAAGLPGGYDYPENSYLLAWEDLLNGGDKDYQDMVVAISGYLPAVGGTTPVPLPAGLLLLGSGLLGFAGLRRRSRGYPRP